MEFKIDTKPNYSVVAPVTNTLNAKLTEALRQKWISLTESGSHNVIVDLHNCIAADETGITGLLSLHEDIYAQNASLVFTQLQNEILAEIKKNETDLVLNIAPTMNEAVDIISMEILERELFDEES